MEKPIQKIMKKVKKAIITYQNSMPKSPTTRRIKAWAVIQGDELSAIWDYIPLEDSEKGGWQKTVYNSKRFAQKRAKLHDGKVVECEITYTLPTSKKKHG